MLDPAIVRNVWKFCFNLALLFSSPKQRWWCFRLCQLGCHKAVLNDLEQKKSKLISNCSTLAIGQKFARSRVPLLGVKIFYVPPFAFLFWGAFLGFVFSGSLFKVLLFSGLVLGRVSAGPGLLCYCSSNMLFVLLTVLSTSLHWEQENQNEVKRWQTLTRAGTD